MKTDKKINKKPYEILMLDESHRVTHMTFDEAVLCAIFIHKHNNNMPIRISQIIDLLEIDNNKESRQLVFSTVNKYSELGYLNTFPQITNGQQEYTDYEVTFSSYDTNNTIRFLLMRGHNDGYDDIYTHFASRNYVYEIKKHDMGLFDSIKLATIPVIEFQHNRILNPKKKEFRTKVERDESGEIIWVNKENDVPKTSVEIVTVDDDDVLQKQLNFIEKGFLSELVEDKKLAKRYVFKRSHWVLIENLSHYLHLVNEHVDFDFVNLDLQDSYLSFYYSLWSPNDKVKELYVKPRTL